MADENAGVPSYQDYIKLVGDTSDRVEEAKKELGGKIDLLADKVTGVMLRQERDITQLKTEAKADRLRWEERFARIEGTQTEHSDAIGALQTQQRTDEAATGALQNARSGWRDWRRWAIGIAAVVAGSVITGIISILPALLHK